MSDFSSLCPIFNTGVYSELTLPNCGDFASKSTTNKVCGGIPFSRSVIITHAYFRRLTADVSTTTNMQIALARAATWAATKSVFASSPVVSKTTTTNPLGRWFAFTVTAKTFSASQVLHVTSLKNSAGAPSFFDVVVRYKEK